MSWGDLVTLFFRFQPIPQQRGFIAVALLWREILLYSSESYDVSGMLGASGAQMSQTTSIFWQSLPFLFALMGAYFCLSDVC